VVQGTAGLRVTDVVNVQAHSLVELAHLVVAYLDEASVDGAALDVVVGVDFHEPAFSLVQVKTPDREFGRVLDEAELAWVFVLFD